MAQIFSRLNIDVSKPTHPIAVNAIQDDAASRFLDVSILDGALPVDLTGHDVRIYIKKPDPEGTEVYNDGEILDAPNGRVMFPLTSQTLAAVGVCRAQIITYKDNIEILTTYEFGIVVAPSLIDDSAIESSNEYGALVVLYQNLSEAYELMKKMVENIGEAGAVSQERMLETIWQTMEYLILKNEEALENASVGEVLNRIGEQPTAEDTLFSELKKAIAAAMQGAGYAKASDTVQKNFGSHETSLRSQNNSYVGELAFKFICDIDGAAKLKFRAKTDQAPSVNTTTARVFQEALGSGGFAELAVIPIGSVSTISSSSIANGTIIAVSQLNETEKDVEIYVQMRKGAEIIFANVIQSNATPSNLKVILENIQLCYDVIGGDSA